MGISDHLICLLRNLYAGQEATVRIGHDWSDLAAAAAAKSLLMKEGSEKADLKLNIQKMKIIPSGPITSWQIGGDTMETVTDFIFLGSKIIADGDAAMKLKDACSLKEKLWQT